MSHGFIMDKGLKFAAFAGDQSATWHHYGEYNMDGKPLGAWLSASGLDFEAYKIPAFARLPSGEMVAIPGQFHIARGDIWGILSDNTVTERYTLHQTTQLAEQFQEYISEDSRFKWDSMISIDGGKTIAMSALFSEDVTAGGDKHQARLLATTSFDATAATVARGHMTRVQCNNTLRAALGEAGGCVRTRHNTAYNRDRVARELEKIVSSFAAYKAMGDAMAETRMGKDIVSKYFKRLLDIPWDAKSDDVSTRKQNQFADLGRAYRATVQEGTEPETAWAALNAVTRYVDHDRSTRGGANETLARFTSSQFGSGAAMKEKAVHLLTVDDDFKALLASTPFIPSTRADGDVKAMLARPFTPSRFQ